jgi:hypothetical protein
MSRWGGFRKGRKKYTNDWDNLKAPSANRAESVAATPQEFSYVEAKGIWSLRSTTDFPKSNQLVPISLTFVDFTTSSGDTQPSISIPATAQAGDLAIYYTAATGLAINKVFPPDFTEVREDHDVDDARMVSGYKILTSSDAGAALTGMNDDHEFSAVMVFRPSRPITSVNTFSVNGQATIVDPSPQTIDMSLAPSYNAILAVAFMVGTTTVVESVPGSMTLVAPSSNSHAFYQIFNTGDALTNLTVDMPDEGDNAMQSWGLATN